MGVISKSRPSAAGVHRCLSVPYFVLPAPPCTISIPVKRLFGAAAVLRWGVCAGTIDSRKGSATAAPMPRSIVRRERFFFVINIRFLLLPPVFRFGIKRSHLERCALH